MLVSHEKKFIFVHIQKTGGLTVERLLKKIVPDMRSVVSRHAYAVDGSRMIPQWDDYYKFAFVRNPWDRLVSWYSMIKAGGDITLWQALANREKARTYLALKRGRWQFWKYVLTHTTSFTEFVSTCGLKMPEGDPNYPHSIYTNQLDYLCDEQGELLVDFIGRFENFESDLLHALSQAGVHIESVPRENASKHKHYSSYYTPETRNLVANIYARDIAAFNYQFENAP